MALPGVLDRTTFADALKIQSVKWMLDRGEEYSGLTSGRIIGKEYRSPLWRGKVALIPQYHAEAARIMALIESLDGVLRTFHLYDPRRKFPISDPGGAADLSGAAILSLGSNNKSMALSGLPEGFVLSVGDFLSFQYGSRPSVALHRVMEAKTATALGNTSSFEVRPHIRLGATSGAAVTLIRPYAEMLMVPGTLDESAEGVMTTLSFEAIQVV